VGKTRLALEVGADLRDEYPDGVWLVDLARLRDPHLLGATIADVLGVQETGRSSTHDLLRDIADRRMLLILDNFEHLLAAAPLVSTLLAGAPGLTVLVTSRSVLRLSGEHVYYVPPLAIPRQEDVQRPIDYLRHDAVQLFVDRARAAAGEFDLNDDVLTAIAQICTHLEGLPLAIELAAIRMRLFTPQDLLLQLTDRFAALDAGPRDAPRRQRTLAATMDWSFALLSPSEQSLFARLGVFAGGCNARAAAAVCGASREDDILRQLESLVDRSLMQRRASPAGARFEMLETVREYALERLEEHGEVEEVW